LADGNQSADFWGRTGCAYLTQDDLPNAFSAFEKFLHFSNESSSQNPVFWYAIGVMYMEYENYDFAAKCFEGAVEMQQKTSSSGRPSIDHKDIQFRLAICHREAGNFDQSLKCFESIAKDPPVPLTSADIVFQMALTHERKKTAVHAQQLYADLLNQFPQHGIVIQQLASTCFKTVATERNGEKQYSKNFLLEDEVICEEDFHKIVEQLQIVNSKLMHKSPKDRALVLFLIGRSYLAFKQAAQAVPYFNQAV
jgi:tetratricopeptide (TPR) repeat protein